MLSTRSARRLTVVSGAVAVVASLTSCAGTSGASTSGPTALRLGYLPNLTQTTAIVGIDHDTYAHALGRGVSLKTQTFNAGPVAMEALAGGALDVAFVGPNPAVNAFVRSRGTTLRIISGSTVGGASLVVRADSGIHSASDLRGKKITSPQLGNTQDVSLRTFAASHGLHTTPQGGGDLTILPVENATAMELFKQGRSDGAWIPEPWSSRLVTEARGEVLVNESSLWPGGRYATTVMVATTAYLAAHGDLIRHLLEGHVAVTDWVNGHGDDARSAVNASLQRLNQKPLSTEVLDLAWKNVQFAVDPVASALRKAATDAHGLGLLASDDLRGICDLSILNQVLRAQNRPPVTDDGLGFTA